MIILLCFAILVCISPNAAQPVTTLTQDTLLMYPPSRAHHFIAQFDNSIVIGYGKHDNIWLKDVWIYLADENQWLQVSSSSSMPTPRSGSCAIVLPELETLYVYGGDTETSSCTNELYSYVYSQNTWSAVLPQKASQQWGSGACHCTLLPLGPTSFAVFGPSAILGYLSEYDAALNTWTVWIASNVDGTPQEDNSAVLGSCCASDPADPSYNVTYCFGGMQYVGNVFRNDFVRIDRSNRTIKKMGAPSSSGNVLWPPGRWRAQCFVGASSGMFYLVGGAVSDVVMDDVWMFNMTTMRWAKLPPTEDTSSSYVAFTTMQRLSDGRLLTFGGATTGSSTAALIQYVDILGEPSSSSLSFSKTLVTTRALPFPRYFPNCFSIAGVLFSAFGLTSVSYFFEPLWKFDINIDRDTMEWTSLAFPSSNKIAYRAYANAIVDGVRVLFLFGLTNMALQTTTNEVVEWYPLLTVQNNTSGAAEEHWRVVARVPNAPTPVARCVASAVKYSERHILIYSGTASLVSSSFLDDIWIYDFYLNAWSEVRVTSSSPQQQQPVPRLSSDFVMTSKGIYLLHGVTIKGVFQSDVWHLAIDDTSQTATWTSIRTNATKQSGGVVASSPLSPYIYSVNGDSFTDDMVFDGKTNTSTVVSVFGKQPLANSGFTLLSDKLLLFGGKEVSSKTSDGVGLIASITIPGMCSDGYAWGQSKSKCEACPPGYFSRKASCVPCDPGTFNPYPAMSSASSCTLCSPGYYQNQPNATACKPCPPNTNCNGLGLASPLDQGSIMTTSTEQQLPRRPQRRQPPVATTYGLPNDKIESILSLGVSLAGFLFTAFVITRVINLYRLSHQVDDRELLDGLRDVFEQASGGTSLLSFDSMILLLDSICTEDSEVPHERELLQFFKNESEFSTHIRFLQFLQILGSVMNDHPKYKLCPSRFMANNNNNNNTKDVADIAFLPPPHVVSWHAFDIFGSASVPDVGEAKLNVRSNAGGAGALVVLAAVFLLVYYYIVDYTDNNILETNSMVPRITLNDNFMDENSVATLKITITLVGYPSSGLCSCNDISTAFSGLTLKQSAGQESLTCSQNTAASTCTVTYQLQNYLLDFTTDGWFSFDFHDERFLAQRIHMVVETSTGGKLHTDISRVEHYVATPDRSSFFRGRGNPTVFEVVAVMTITSTLGERHLGYMLDMVSSQPGEVATGRNALGSRGHIVLLKFDASTSTAILVTRDQRVMWITFISNVLSCGSAIINIGGVVLIVYFGARKKLFMKAHSQHVLPHHEPSLTRRNSIENCQAYLPYLKIGLRFAEARAFFNNNNHVALSANTTTTSSPSEVVVSNRNHEEVVNPITGQEKFLPAASMSCDGGDCVLYDVTPVDGKGKVWL